MPRAFPTRRSASCATTIRSRTTTTRAGTPGYWAVTRHADVQRVSRDWTGVPERTEPVPPRQRPTFDDGGTSLLLISLDPPEHTKLRKLISSGFTPRRINDLAAHVKARVDSVIDSVADRGECDLVKRHRPVAAAARDRRPRRRARGRPQAGLRVDRADLRLRSRRCRRRNGWTRRRRCSRTPTRCVPSVAPTTHATT